MKDTFAIALITKPHGVRGELKITPYNGDVTRFKKLKTLLIDGKTYTLQGVKPCGEFLTVCLSGVNDRTLAESFRGKEICINRADAVELSKGEFYIQDIEGCTLLTEKGKTLGRVIEVISSKTDVLVAKDNNDKIFRFPFLKDLLIKVDLENNQIIVLEQRFMEVNCYED